jgi:hypothetical protein
VKIEGLIALNRDPEYPNDESTPTSKRLFQLGFAVSPDFQFVFSITSVSVTLIAF